MSSWIAARTTLPQIMSSCSADTAQKTVPETISSQSHLAVILHKNSTGDNLISVSSCSADTAQKQYRRQSHLSLILQCRHCTKTVPETISSHISLILYCRHCTKTVPETISSHITKTVPQTISSCIATNKTLLQIIIFFLLQRTQHYYRQFHLLSFL